MWIRWDGGSEGRGGGELTHGAGLAVVSAAPTGCRNYNMGKSSGMLFYYLIDEY